MRTVAAIAVALLTAPALAQVSEVIEVRVANVDVVVLDRAGKPVKDAGDQRSGEQHPSVAFEWRPLFHAAGV